MTSATEYLLELLEEGGDDAMDFWATVSEIAGATITAFSTEVPEWLKAAAREQLSEVFQYDYWLNVGETTREAVRATIERGINDGLSIREVADLIQEERGEGYARYRAVNTARTETNNALNRGASSAIETLEQETGLEMQKEWMSQYSTTTRPNHAAMDGQVSVGPNKLFAFVAQDGNTYNIPEPGDPSLPAEDRCQCGCGVLSSFVGEEVDRSDLDAVREELLSTDAPTLLDMERSHHHHGTKYSEDQPRDEAGRFGEGGRVGSSTEQGGTTAEWRASMPKEDADAWASESALKEPFYHGTGITEHGVVTPDDELSARIESIKKDGFKVNTTTNGRQLGDGIYVADNQEQTQRYGKTLELRINVKNPLQVNQGEWIKTYAKIQREAKKAGVFKTMNTSERINWWAKKEGYDAIRMTEGLRQMVVFDPKNITVVE